MSQGPDAKRGLDLIIAIYLDTNALLDILGSIEDGFALVEKVTTQTSTSGTTERSVGTEFGIPNILNLLKISIGASRATKQADESAEVRHLERYHTYGTLLYKLRSNLAELGLLKAIAGADRAWKEVRPSDFVELRGVFHPNPLVESLGTIDRLLGMALLFSETQMQTAGQPKRDRHKIRDEIRQSEQLRKLLTSIRSDVEREDVRTFVVELTDSSGYRAVVPLFIEYLRDRSMTELSHKEFRLLGKVVRNLSEEDEVIDLLRGTGLGGVSDEVLQELLAAFKEMEVQGFRLPRVETKIMAPALEVVPIAIYV
jgi:hypothetical protein